MAHPRNKHERRHLQGNKQARKRTHAQQERDEAMLQAIAVEVPEDYYAHAPFHA